MKENEPFYQLYQGKEVKLSTIMQDNVFGLRAVQQLLRDNVITGQYLLPFENEDILLWINKKK